MWWFLSPDWMRWPLQDKCIYDQVASGSTTFVFYQNAEVFRQDSEFQKTLQNEVASLFSPCGPEARILPAILTATKAIVMANSREENRQLIDEGFDIALFVQELRHGVADVTRMTTWLCRLLQTCLAEARMKECIVVEIDLFQESVLQGIRNHSIADVVLGIEDLVRLFCAMLSAEFNRLQPRLAEDMAILRPIFLEDTHQVPYNAACVWYWQWKQSVFTLRAHQATFGDGDMDIFCIGLAGLLLPITDECDIPFHLGHHLLRMRTLFAASADPLTNFLLRYKAAKSLSMYELYLVTESRGSPCDGHFIDVFIRGAIFHWELWASAYQGLQGGDAVL